ncbi:MAG: hypothetical protein AAFR33_11850 [Pseudomonadota bacterium]
MPDTHTQAERARVRKDVRRAAKRIENGFPPEGSAPAPLVNTMTFGADAMKHWLETSQDLARFYNARLAKDFSYMTELATCRSPGDLTALWCRAASEAAHDYANELDRLMAINTASSAEENQAPAE